VIQPDGRRAGPVGRPYGFPRGARESPNPGLEERRARSPFCVCRVGSSRSAGPQLEPPRIFVRGDPSRRQRDCQPKRPALADPVERRRPRRRGKQACGVARPPMIPSAAKRSPVAADPRHRLVAIPMARRGGSRAWKRSSVWRGRSARVTGRSASCIDMLVAESGQSSRSIGSWGLGSDRRRCRITLKRSSRSFEELASLVKVISGSSYGFEFPDAISSDGTHVWVANGPGSGDRPLLSAGNTVTELSASTGTLVKVISGSSYGFNGPLRCPRTAPTSGWPTRTGTA
jgi:hypothetical protein